MSNTDKIQTEGRWECEEHGLVDKKDVHTCVEGNYHTAVYFGHTVVPCFYVKFIPSPTETPGVEKPYTIDDCKIDKGILYVVYPDGHLNIFRAETDDFTGERGEDK